MERKETMNLADTFKKIKGVENVFFNADNTCTVFYSKNLAEIQTKMVKIISDKCLQRAIERINFYSV